MRTLSRALLACVLLAALPSALYAEFPKYTGFVNDFANLLSPAARAELEQLLRDTGKQTTAEVALATVSTLDGMSVEEYANRLFKEWGIGKDAIDNGVLVLVAPNEREMRIEVGYGLEPVIPDGLAGQIIRETFLPRFRDGDYPGGITDGVARVVDLVRRKHILTAEERAALAESAEDKAPWYVTIPFFGMFVGIGFYMVGIGLGAKAGFPMFFGSFFGGVPLLRRRLVGRRRGQRPLVTGPNQRLRDVMTDDYDSLDRGNGRARRPRVGHGRNRAVVLSPGTAQFPFQVIGWGRW